MHPPCREYSTKRAETGGDGEDKMTIDYGDGGLFYPETISNRNEAIVALRGDDDCSGIIPIHHGV